MAHPCVATRAKAAGRGARWSRTGQRRTLPASAGWLTGTGPLVLCLFLLATLLVPAPALDAIDPAISDQPAYSVRIPFDIPVLMTHRGVIDVPILVRHQGESDLLVMGLDYDELMLDFVGFAPSGGGIATNVLEESVDRRNGRLNAAIEFDPFAPRGEEVVLLWAQFQFMELAFQDGVYGSVTSIALDLREEETRFVPIGEPIGTGVSLDVAPQYFMDGGLTVYLRDMIELGSARLSAELQTFTLPVYVTHLEPATVPLSMGLDYDELFLTLIDVTPAPGDGPQHALGPPGITWSGKSAGGPASIEVNFGAHGYPRLLRHHLLDLRFELVPSAQLPRTLAVTPTLGESFGIAAVGGGQGTELRRGTLHIVSSPFLRGDVSGNRRVDLTDALLILASAYQGELGLDCRQAADADASGSIDVTDAVYIVNFLFRAGPPPSPPYPAVGSDLADDADDADDADGGLDCQSYGDPYFEPLTAFED